MKPALLMKSPLLLLACWLAAGPTIATASQKLTYADLVQRLTDLEHLATLPQEGERTAQWSSYDRASRYDAKSAKYLGWDANGDGHGIMRKEGSLQVLAEMQGPGCIWRIWSATPKQGRVRIYLDGASEPAVDLPFIGYFDGKNAPFTRPALVHTVARGWNNYTPIPYRKSCKIVAEEGWGDYFQFVYTTFPKDTQTPAFSRELSAQDNAALDRANALLTQCGPRSPGQAEPSAEILLSGGGSHDQKLDGPGAITSLRLQVELPPPPADRDPLRELALEIRWDGESSPSVWCPIGDFFGAAPGANVYRSLPAGMTEDGWFYANWHMPFANSAAVRIVNQGKADRRLKLDVRTVALPEADFAKLGRFHAKWHRDQFLPTAPERAIDWTLLNTTGRGRFVGVMLHIWNPRGGWWGEGDEKFFVDGEKFPSTIGTGSEDYFGYAWCDPALFQNAFHNQPHNDGNNRGHVSVNRWHIADQIPFHKSFEGYIEKYYPNERPTLYSATIYWYLAPGGKDPYSPVPLAERLNYYVAPVPHKVAGALEGETLKILSKTRGNTEEQDMTLFGDQWSNDGHLWWTGAGPGDKLELSIPVAKSGRYRVLARLTKAVDYGIVQLAMDGKPIGAPIDLFNNGVVPTTELDLGIFELTPGEHKLGIEIVGANPKAVKNYMFALDYLKLREAKD